MKLRLPILFLFTLILTWLGYFMIERGKEPVSVNGSSAFILSESQVAELMVKARAGDCHAAFRVAQHLSYVALKFDEAIPWLRLASNCPEVQPKELLVAMLLEEKDQSRVAAEINRLIVEMQKTDPTAAKRANAEVEERRNRQRQ